MKRAVLWAVAAVALAVLGADTGFVAAALVLARVELLPVLRVEVVHRYDGN